MCDLYLSRRCTNMEISEYWSWKIRPEQYVLFNLSSLINQKQYFLFNNNHSQATLSFDQTIDLIITDPEFISRQWFFRNSCRVCVFCYDRGKPFGSFSMWIKKISDNQTNQTLWRWLRTSERKSQDDISVYFHAPLTGMLYAATCRRGACSSSCG